MIIHWDMIPPEYNIVVAACTEFDVPVIAVNDEGSILLDERNQYVVEYVDHFYADDCFYGENIVSFHRPKENGE